MSSPSDNQPHQPQPAPQPIPQGYFIPFPQQEPEDEINLLDLWRVLVENKKTIIAITFACTLIATIAVFMKTPIYRAEVLLSPVSSEGVGKRGLGAFASQFGGLASLAGISMPGGGDVETALATIKSRKFITEYVAAENLKPILFEDNWDAGKQAWIQKTSSTNAVKSWLLPSTPDMNRSGEQLAPGEPSAWNVYNLFSNILFVSQDKKTGLVTVAVEWKDPMLAAQWANRLVVKLNTELRQRAVDEGEKSIAYLNQQIEQTSISDLRSVLFKLIEEHTKSITLAKANEEYALKVIDPASPPERKIKPNRKLMLVLGVITGGVLSLLIVFVRRAFSKIKDASDGKLV
jgi:uncharacterized protein involved in exopolysaccharide biosynthesis